MNDFYVEVISNGSFHSNTLCIFKNRIQLMHPLSGDWEVGLSEISYTKSWYNIDYNSTIQLEADATKPIYDLSKLNYVAIDGRSGTLKRGYYDDIATLVSEINKEIEWYHHGPIKRMPQLFYDSVATKCVYIRPGEWDNGDKLYPYLNYELRSLLGFEEYDLKKMHVNDEGIVLPQRPADITGGIRQLLVYCSLILPQYVGDSRTKLLRCIEIPGNAKFGEQIIFRYEKPHYIPLLVNDFHEIEINIKDDMNDYIRFRFGRTRVKLHFRQK